MRAVMWQVETSSGNTAAQRRNSRKTTDEGKLLFVKSHRKIRLLLRLQLSKVTSLRPQETLKQDATPLRSLSQMIDSEDATFIVRTCDVLLDL